MIRAIAGIVTLISILALASPLPAADDGAGAKALEAQGRSLVLVEIFLSRREDVPRSPEQLRSLGHVEQERERLRELGTPLVFPGVVVGKGEVLFSDPHLDAEDYGRVRILGWDGKRREGKLAGMLRDAPGLLAAFEPGEEPLPAVRFSAPGPLGLASVQAVWIERLKDRIVLRAQSGTLDGLLPDGGIFRQNPFPAGALLLDAEGKAVGVALGDFLYDEPWGRSTFVGLELLKTPGIPQEELTAAYAAIRSRIRRATVRVRIEYYLPGKDEARGFSPGPPGGNQADDEGYGYLLSPGRVILPFDPGQEKVRRIARVVALVGEGSAVKEIEGTFLGALKKYEALFLSFPELEGGEPAKISAKEPPGRFEHCVLATPERRFGRDRVNLLSVRRLGESVTEERGEELRRPTLNPDPPSGSVITDLEGRILGIVTREKKEGEEGEPVSPFFEPSALSIPEVRVYWSREEAGVWAAPADHFDPRAVPRSRRGARRLVWLGVEYQYIGKALAREIRVQKATRDGERGLLVNLVYADSPAAKLGIRAGDVLLYLLEEGKAESERRELLRPSYHEWRSEMSSGGFRFASRTNELTRLLTSIGEGEKVKFVWLRDGAELSGDLSLSEAPPDFDSAEKWKDERLGITVKALTYEVRAFYRLKEDAPGVIVARIESGSPAELAEMEPQAILETVNGRTIAGVEEYRKAVEEILADGDVNLTFFMRILAGARFVEVKPERLADTAGEGD